MIEDEEIGGYFELELSKGIEYHQNAIRLNTGRNAFEYVLRTKQYKKVYLPYFTCDVMLEPIQKLNLKVEFYSIDETFRPLFDYSKLNDSDVFVYTNYFGICNLQVLEAQKKCKNLIIDNAQAFYATPLSGVDTFYSPRKFFGVPDGAYLYTDIEASDVFETDLSYTRFTHLVKRLDLSAEEGYLDFVSTDQSLNNNTIKQMSLLTRRLLSSINYVEIGNRRRTNFIYLHEKLTHLNKLKFDFEHNEVPMVYPYWASKEVRTKLLDYKIYTATYWPNIKEWCKQDDLELKMMDEIIYLPIDQRQTKEQLDKIIKIIMEWE